jgi:hypothetical protein
MGSELAWIKRYEKSLQGRDLKHVTKSKAAMDCAYLTHILRHIAKDARVYGRRFHVSEAAASAEASSAGLWIFSTMMLDSASHRCPTYG